MKKHWNIKRLSSAAVIALKDRAKIKKSKTYKISDETWHYPVNPHCSVCFAGAVMALELNADPSQCIHPGHFDIDTQFMLKDLDRLRRGDANLLLNASWKSKEDIKKLYAKCDFPESGGRDELKWLAYMQRAIAILKNNGD